MTIQLDLRDLRYFETIADLGHLGRAAEVGLAVLDVLRAWTPSKGRPLNPAGVVEEIAEILKSYGLSRVTGDRFGAEWVFAVVRS